MNNCNISIKNGLEKKKILYSLLKEDTVCEFYRSL